MTSGRLAHLRRRHVDHRRVSGYGDVLGHSANLHLRVDGDGLTEDDDDVVALELLEALKVKRQLVSARRHPREQELPIGLGHRRSNADLRRRCRRYGNAWKHRALGVCHDAGQTSLADLRISRR